VMIVAMCGGRKVENDRTRWPGCSSVDGGDEVKY
jgi:hypothetical protein